jgi:hypothetical protein
MDAVATDLPERPTLYPTKGQRFVDPVIDAAEGDRVETERLAQ